MEVFYFINGQEVNRPLNYKQLTVELNYDKDRSDNAVSLTEFEWGLGSQVDGKDAAQIINDYRRGGLSGGVGVFEGLPFRIEIVESNKTLVLHDGYLDASSALYDSDKVVISSIERKNVDWLNDVADSWSYDFGFENEEFDSSEFIPIPYIISTIPDTAEATMALLSLFSMVITVADQVISLAEYIAEGATVINSIGAAAKIIIRLAYIAILILSIVNVLIHLINVIIQPVKFMHGMTIKRLCEIGAEHFDMSFESPILDQDPFDRAVIIPRKFNQPVNDTTNALFGGIGGVQAAFVTSRTYGFTGAIDPTARGFFRGTYGELLRALKIMFKAKILIEDGVLKLVPKNFNNSSPQYTIPPIDITDFKLNFEELKSNYTVEFQTDINDKNTMQNYEGVFTQVITQPKGVNNKDTVLMKGVENNNIPFARGHGKKQLTTPEGIINSMLGLINSLFGVPQNVFWNPLGDIGDRIDMMLLENDFIDVPKIVLIDQNQDPFKTVISTDNETFVNSDYLYRNHHSDESFVPSPSRPNANQHKIIEKGGFSFVFVDYELLRNNNFLKDDDGKSGELISARWFVELRTVDLEFKINELYTDNLKETIRTPDGK